MPFFSLKNHQFIEDSSYFVQTEYKEINGKQLTVVNKKKNKLVFRF